MNHTNHPAKPWNAQLPLNTDRAWNIPWGKRLALFLFKEIRRNSTLKTMLFLPIPCLLQAGRGIWLWHLVQTQTRSQAQRNSGSEAEAILRQVQVRRRCWEKKEQAGRRKREREGGGVEEEEDAEEKGKGGRQGKNHAWWFSNSFGDWLNVSCYNTTMSN